MWAVVKETQCTSAARCVVDDLSHHRLIFAEVKLVSDANFSRRVHEHIPKAHFAVQFPQQKNLDACAGFFLVTIEACGKDLCVVEHEHVAFVEVLEDIAERLAVFNDAAFGVNHHEATFVAEAGGVLSDTFLGKFEFEL